MPIAPFLHLFRKLSVTLQLTGSPTPELPRSASLYWGHLARVAPDTSLLLRVMCLSA